MGAVQWITNENKTTRNIINEFTDTGTDLDLKELMTQSDGDSVWLMFRSVKSLILRDIRGFYASLHMRNLSGNMLLKYFILELCYTT